MAKNGKDTNHTSHIARRVNFVRNGETTKCILLEICLVCMVSLPFLNIHADTYYPIQSEEIPLELYLDPFFNISWIKIIKCDKAIPAVHAALYSLSALDYATGTGTCVPL